ncbi:DUF3857 domain-containing protein [Flavobacterium sufflavum]|uniref:DUF3857 domain-containing protein n=1 Tax=Flavobacterium sufflavum TaxID=1921138 RepID=A0A3S2TZM4_9FLAO|nr:DUF3857 domain-containing transglutaminase family protein [Flavobacterium sufflavum]RVT73158.1 DUF3857 domain-containing protein [Flavobacterium sufflavum]
MKIRILQFAIFLMFFGFKLQAQKNEFPVSLIADSLKENANAVVRLNQIDVIISSQRSMNVKTKRVITVFNENGLSAVDAFENYDKTTSVKNVEVRVIDPLGNEIKKIKRKDFKDVSAISGSTLFSDARYIYLDYTPTQYPFTVIYDSEVENSNTAFIPGWFPVKDYLVGVEQSILNVTYPNNLGFKKKEFNFKGFNIQKTTDTSTQLSYKATGILAQKQEPYCAVSVIFPRLLMGLESFNLEGEDGTAKSWNEFGKWYYDEILKGTTQLSPETVAKIKTLVGNETDPIKKAKLIYDYVQKKTRYVSIQVGIGGWKPMLADDVDRLGYGDCKALTNYTRALLDVVGVPSYNTILYGDPYKRNIETDFVSIQGNHMILAIPNGNDYIWLECTSQDDPFGYQGKFTDDRTVLVIKPTGGEIVQTKIYEDKGNLQNSKGAYSIDEQGNLSGRITIASEGSQYSNKASLENSQPNEKETHYKEYWSNINNLKLAKINFSNDKEKIAFVESLDVNANNYASISGAKMIFPLNAYNQFSGSVKRIRNRKNPFEIQRGYVDVDEVEVVLPFGFAIEFLPSNFESNSKFGDYKTEIIKKDATHLVYKRTLYIHKGFYPNTEYDQYRLFMEQVSRNDNAKIILTKI